MRQHPPRFLLGVSLIAFGCAGPPQPVEVELPKPVQLSEKPVFTDSRLGVLVSVDDDRRVKVGDEAAEVLRLFPASSSSKGITELPPTIGGPYRAKGWEDKTGGFATVIYEGRVVLAVRRSTTDSSDLTRTLLAYTEGFGDGTPVEPLGPNVDYWFWQDNGHRLMLSVLRTKEGGIVLTEAIGTDAVMTAIGAHPLAARRQKTQAEAELRKHSSPSPK